MKNLFEDKKKLFIVLMGIGMFAGFSNFMEPANLLVMSSIAISLMVIVFGNDMSTLYLILALCPFYNSLNLNGVSAGFVIPFLASVKLVINNMKSGLSPYFIASIVFLLVWFIHDIQYRTYASTLISLFVPCYVFLFISMKNFDNYDGYYAMWIVICSSLIAMVSVFLVQGGSLDAFLQASYSGEMRLGEADTDAGEKNQLDGAMGFPIYTLTVITLLLQMLMTRRYTFVVKLLFGVIMIGLLFITFLTVSRVYLLGLATLVLLLCFHVLKRRSLSTIMGGSLIFIFILVVSSDYLGGYLEVISSQYQGRMDIDGGNSGLGVRGTIYQDCISYLSENYECLLIGKGNGAYPLIGAELHRPMSQSAHNMILDALMSFGALGSMFVASIYFKAYKKENSRLGIKWTVFRIIPFACVFIMYQTASPFLLDKTYPFLLFLVLNIIHCTDDSPYDPKWATDNGFNVQKI